MATLNETLFNMATAALSGDALLTRSYAQDLDRQRPKLSEALPPQSTDMRLLAVAAALIELFAARWHQPNPDWTTIVGALPQPVYLVQSARTMKRLRALCEQQAPEPLRKRNLFAPPNYLELV
jgi:hypothetical protein